jgi:eukaryotic-like serine/threonine-protein kinase
MGSVWRAEHIDLGTPAAVKLIDESFAQSPEALTRFRREAQAAASLRSANVVQILDYGVDGETPFIAMELLEGESLAERIERTGGLPPAQCAGVLVQVSKALSRAHELGIVHRDLKPDNIYLVHDGEDEIAKVLDFGIAKRTGALQTSSDMATRTGSLMGTPYYMSPEQASGRRQVDHHTDIWAFAIIAYECLTGRRPFDDTNLGGLLLSICTEQPASASQVAAVPAGFDAWFARCTAKDPAGRYETIREAAHALCVALGVAPPTRSVLQSQADGIVDRPATASVVAGSLGASRAASAMTPGAVIVTNAGATSGAPRVRAKKVLPKVLLAGGSILVVGLLSVVGALIMRSTLPSRPTLAQQGASLAPMQVLSAPLLAASSAAPNLAPTVQLVTPVATVVPINSAAASPDVVASVKVPTPRPVVGPRQTVRSVSAQSPKDPAPAPRQRPQDRLERDLGF